MHTHKINSVWNLPSLKAESCLSFSPFQTLYHQKFCTTCACELSRSWDSTPSGMPTRHGTMTRNGSVQRREAHQTAGTTVTAPCFCAHAQGCNVWDSTYQTRSDAYKMWPLTDLFQIADGISRMRFLKHLLMSNYQKIKLLNSETTFFKNHPHSGALFGNKKMHSFLCFSGLLCFYDLFLVSLCFLHCGLIPGLTDSSDFWVSILM